MAEKNLYDKIVEKGITEAEVIYRSGEAKTKQIIDEALTEAQKEADKIITDVKRRADDRIKTKTIEFEQQAKHNLLKKKKELIDQVFLAVIKKLKGLPDDKFTSLTVKMLKTEKLVGNEVLKVAADEIERYRGLFSLEKNKNEFYSLDKLNTLLGPNYHLKLSAAPVDIDGGFLVVGKEYDVDLSYRSLLTIIKEKYEPEIAKIIFQAEE